METVFAFLGTSVVVPEIKLWIIQVYSVLSERQHKGFRAC